MSVSCRSLNASFRSYHEPEIKAQIAQALMEGSHETTVLEIAYRTDPVLWATHVLGITPQQWQEQFLRAPRGASILVLTSRQVGKTTAAAIGMAHTAVFKPGSLSVVACPSQSKVPRPFARCAKWC